MTVHLSSDQHQHDVEHLQRSLLTDEQQGLLKEFAAEILISLYISCIESHQRLVSAPQLEL